MAEARRRVFVGKVLERLFPRVPYGQEKRATLAPAPKNPPEKVTPGKAKCGCVPPLTGGDTEVQPGRRLYTVSLPPEGYVPVPPEPPRCTSSEHSSSGDDTGDQDPHDQPKRRRIRKPKSRKKFQNPSNVPVERELEKQQSLSQEKLQPRHTDGPTISKNKKRKLKKKQQIKRKKAAGLLTRASGVSFTYQPEDSSSEQGAVRASDGEDATEGDVADAEEGATEEGGKGTNEKADGILDFLKSTQEIYFYDGAAADPDAVSVESAEQLLRCVEAGGVSPSDLCALGRLQALLLLRDAEGLRGALDAFPQRCALPPDHARVISAFFNYWITHILPEKNSE
ncbi:glutamate-rich protein 1 isoform 1-T1 [Hipposideros larvatus]